MEGAHSEKDHGHGAFGGLFQTIVNDLRGSTPIWEDFTYKSMKLHSSLKTTVATIGAFLEAFQKVADMATSSKGATREIGSALTRLCMRHRSIESHLKILTSSILDNLVAPLQEKLEDWKKAVAQIDKDHAKEYKKSKQEIKKAASDTMRLQKKVKKGGSHGKSEMQHKLDSAMIDVNSKYHQLEETEKNSVRSALIEERSRFCLFITCLKPFVDHELKLLTEISHINEIMESLCFQAGDPAVLPASSEQVILDLKGVDSATFNFSQQSPPSSPSSLGSRKSSMCSINSINSSSSGSSKSHSPSHTMHKRTTSQPPLGAIRLTSVSSQDSGFTSQDTLFLRPNTPQSLNLYQASATIERDGDGDCDSTPTTPSDNTPSASSTWNNWPNPPGGPRADPGRPHTISSAYEKGHNRPALKPDMFEPPQEGVEMRPKVNRSISHNNSSQNRPSATINKLQPVLPPHCPKPKVKAVAPPVLPPGVQPIYANMAELEGRRGSQSDNSPDDGEPTTPTTPASTSITQIQQNTSLELAKAIRELEASTAALTSAYDTDAYTNAPPTAANTTATNNSHAPSANTATYDADSYTSKTSLPCSSGYGTMNSTPAGSEGTIASGGVPENIVETEESELYEEIEREDCALIEADGFECEKYFTIPRSGEANAAFRAAIFPKRPASTTGIPASGANIPRRSSINSQKPPPPVRRTSSVTGAPPPHVQKLRASPPKQISADGAYATGGGEGMVEGAYAELQLIQQSIHGHPQQGQGTPAKAQQPQGYRHGGVQPQNSGGGQYAQAPPQGPVQTTKVIQGLNAKFASLNSQYQEGNGHDVVDGGGEGDMTVTSYKPPPPAVMQKPTKPGVPTPTVVQGSQHTQHHPQQHHPQHHQQHHHQGAVHNPTQRGHSHQGPRHPGHHPHQNLHQQHARQLQQQQQQRLHHHHQQQQQQQSHYYETNSHQQQMHRNPQQHQHHNVPGTVPEEDFPLPPTAEELQEMERIYSRPPPIGPSVRAPIQRPQQKLPVQPPSGAQQQQQPQDVQASLLMELKRRVSVDDTSNV